MANIRTFVKIRPIETKSPTGLGFNKIRLSINRLGTATNSIADSFHQTTELIRFENEFLSKSSRTQIEDVKEEGKEKKSLFARAATKLRKKFSKTKRDKQETSSEAARGSKKGEKDAKKRFEQIKKPFEGFLKGIASLFGNLIMFAITYGALDWLSNKQNAENATKVVKLIWHIGKFGYWLAKNSIGLILDGLTNVIGDFGNEGAIRRSFRFMLGAFQMLGGIAALRTAQYLIMPWKLMKDINLLRSVFGAQAQTQAEVEESTRIRKTGYRDTKTGVIYSEEEYKQMKKSAAKADAKRARKAGKGMSSDLYQGEVDKRFVSQFDGKKKNKLAQRARIGMKRAGKPMKGAFRNIGKFAKANPGKVAGGLSVLGGGMRIASGLAMGESAGTAVGAGVGQAAGGIIGGIAGTALLGPFLGPFAPIVGNAIGGFLGEFIGSKIGPIIEPIFEPIGRYFQMIFKVIGGAFGPLFNDFGEMFGALFDFIGQLAKMLFKAADIFFQFHKFVFGLGFGALGKTIGFIVNNVKRLTDPASVGKGIADALTLNLFDFDGENKKAAGGPVEMKSGGALSFGSHPDMLAATGGILLQSIVGGFKNFGFVGSKVLQLMSGDVNKIGGILGVKVNTSSGSGSKLGNSLSLDTSTSSTSKVADVTSNLSYKKNVHDAIKKGLNGVLLAGIKLFDPEAAKAIEQRNNSGGGGVNNGGGNQTPGGPVGSFSGNANSGSVQAKGVNIANNFKQELGITKEAAAAIAGNFAHESSGFIPGIREGGPFGQSTKPWPKNTVGRGYGWAQWTNAAPGDRYDKFIQSYGGDYNKIPTNEDNWKFAVSEMKGPEPLGSSFSSMTDVAAAAVWFRKHWERAGVHHDEPRIQYAQQFLTEMAKGGIVPQLLDAGGEVDKDGLPKDPKMLKRLKKSKQNMTDALRQMAGGGELDKLDFAKGASRGPGTPGGMCVAGVIYTAEANNALLGAPEVSGGVDPNNHPRGLMAWAVKKGYGSIPGTKGKPRNIKGAFGDFGVTSMTESQWGDAVVDGLIPNGSLIFNTRHGWDWNGGSSGNDAAISQNGGAMLWSGHEQSAFTYKGKTVGAVYSDVKEIVALTHPQGNTAAHDGLTSSTGGAQSNNASNSGSGKNGGVAPAAPAKPKTIEEMMADFKTGLADALTKFGKVRNASSSPPVPAPESETVTKIDASTAPVSGATPVSASNLGQLSAIRDKATKDLTAIADKARRDEEKNQILPIVKIQPVVQKISQPINTGGGSQAIYAKPSQLLTQ